MSNREQILNCSGWLLQTLLIFWITKATITDGVLVRPDHTNKDIWNKFGDCNFHHGCWFGIFQKDKYWIKKPRKKNTKKSQVRVPPQTTWRKMQSPNLFQISLNVWTRPEATSNDSILNKENKQNSIQTVLCTNQKLIGWFFMEELTNNNNSTCEWFFSCLLNKIRLVNLIMETLCT